MTPILALHGAQQRRGARLAQGFTETVVSEVRLGRAAVQLVDSHWDADALIADCDADVRVRWRIRPAPLKVRPIEPPQDESGFGRLSYKPSNVATYARAGRESEHVRTAVCRFDPDWGRGLIQQDACWMISSSSERPDLQSLPVAQTMRRLAAEIATPGMATAAMCEGLVITILVDLARHFAAHEGESKSGATALPWRTVEQIHDCVRSAGPGCPTISEIARDCGLSVAHLGRLYKNATGWTLSAFIEQHRVQRARDLLENTRMPLKRISFELGFKHPSAFSLAFKRATTIPPKAYRQRFGRCGLGE